MVSHWTRRFPETEIALFVLRLRVVRLGSARLWYVTALGMCLAMTPNLGSNRTLFSAELKLRLNPTTFPPSTSLQSTVMKLSFNLLSLTQSGRRRSNCLDDTDLSVDCTIEVSQESR